MSRQVFITGASRGIGKAIANKLKDENLTVIAPSRHDLDLSDISSVQAYLKENVNLTADILINNAGENIINTIPKTNIEDWQRMLTINLSAAFLLLQFFATKMANKGWGRIINISSCYGIVSREGRAAYSASKTGLIGLTRTAAIEFGKHGVLINAVCPGFIETDLTRKNNTEEQLKILSQQTALQRLALPHEIAEFISFLV
ncbi:MAG: SDR family oxidoreductase, partial [Deltaproteobacteria bacterium]|nr:SDR family oxidoreductase [Deltaproteobacteria bacterium]